MNVLSKVKYDGFEHKLVYHTAPTLLGIKCASLIAFSVDEFDINVHSQTFNRKAVSKGLKMEIMCKCTNRVLALIYSEKLLKIRLADVNVQRMLKDCGYPKEFTVESCLECLSNRISTKEEFPHEIGIFLGYPLEDVIGFIRNKGENFKLCGCWKVYGNAKKAKRIFDNYDKCRKFLYNKLNEGSDIYQALKIS